MKRLLRVFLWVQLPLAAVLAAGLIFSRARGFPLSVLMKDPVGQLHAPLYTGAISNLGVLLWAAGAAICLFAAADRRRLGGGERRTFVLGLGLLTAWLALDDLYLLHEQVILRLTSIREMCTQALYAAGLLFWLVRFREVVRGTAYPVLLCALLLFTLSCGVDLIHGVVSHRSLIEDGSKLLGIGAWLGYLAGVCWEER